MKIALIPNLTRACAMQVTLEVCDILDRLNVQYFFEKDLEESIPKKDCFLETEKLLPFCDIVIAIGGDGSLIHAAKKAVLYKKPVLGINAGNLAFMAGIEKNELHLLEDLIIGNYSIDPRMMFEVFYKESEEAPMQCLGRCLNDVVIARGAQIKLVTLDVFADEKLVNHYYTDGIILSTPTGSTAYSLSAGGPVVDPNIESIILTPICTHSLFARSLIFEKNAVIKIAVPNKAQEVSLSCDGDDAIEIKPGSTIYIRKSEDYADFIRIKNDSFIDILNSKLSQRRA